MTETINSEIVRSYDLRGVFGSELIERDARALGLRVATTVRARGGERVAVGYDGRLSSPLLAAALSAGLAAGGTTALEIGLGPTGMLYHAVHANACDAGVMVTGSHNPASQNGFKTVIGGEPVHGAALQALVSSEGVVAAGGSVAALAVEDDYVARLLTAANGSRPLSIGWDPGNGATGAVLARLVAALAGRHVVINGAIDGRFPAHHPDPSVPENLLPLQQLVRNEALDLGIAFDGDGDRIGVICGEGEIVWPDQLLLLLARDVLSDHPGATIVADVKSSHVLFDGIAAGGGRAVLSPSGYPLVRAAMFRDGAVLGGEMSGHIFYMDRWPGTDDALHVAMRLLAALGRGTESMAAFRRSLPPTFATPELRLPCPDADKQQVLDAVAAGLDGFAVERIDGLRVTTDEGWWLLRASGTEPKLTARIEAWTSAARTRLEAELFARLRAAGWRG
jgi:phosphomannomutase